MYQKKNILPYHTITKTWLGARRLDCKDCCDFTSDFTLFYFIISYLGRAPSQKSRTYVNPNLQLNPKTE